MFEANTAAPTVNQPSDLLARKYCSRRGVAAEARPDADGGDADQVDGDDDEVDGVQMHCFNLITLGRSKYHRPPPAETSSTLE